MEKIQHDSLIRIEELIKSGFNPADIAVKVGVSVEVVLAVRRLSKNKQIAKGLAVPDNLASLNINTLADLIEANKVIPSHIVERKKKTAYFRGAILVALGFSIHQVQVFTDLTRGQIKCLLRKTRALRYVYSPDPSKKKILRTSLAYRLIESIFCSLYCRIVGIRKIHEINLSAFLESYIILLDLLSKEEYAPIVPSNARVSLKDLMDSLLRIREKEKVFNFCYECDCYYVAKTVGRARNYCPFCLFKKKYSYLENQLHRRYLARKKRARKSTQKNGEANNSHLSSPSSESASIVDSSLMELSTTQRTDLVSSGTDADADSSEASPDVPSSASTSGTSDTDSEATTFEENLSLVLSTPVRL